MARRKTARRMRAERKQNMDAGAPIVTTDAFSNPAARIGFGTMDLLQGTEYPMTRMTQDYQLLTSLYRDNWIVQNIVATIPNDIIRKWYEIRSGATPEMSDSMRRLERVTQLRKKLLQGMCWGRLYGGAVGVILIRGQDDLSVPLDPDTILPGGFLGLQLLDRWSGVYPDAELVSDPSDADFGLPEYYTVRDDVSGRTAARVHHSRVIRFIGRELPWLEQVAEQYWGESEIEAIYSEVVKRDNVSGNIAALTFRANVNYMEADGLDQLLATGNAAMQKRFWNLMSAQAVMESNFGLRIINKGDAVHNTQYTFSGLADVYDRIMMDVAGAARTPVTKLFGRSPAGMNATGESDMRNYYDYIDGLRETDFRSIVERLLPVMALSAWGKIPDDLEISFPPMQTPEPKETAEIAERRANTILAAFQNNLIDVSVALQELTALSDETGLFGRIPDEAVEAGRGKTCSDLQMMRDPLAGLGMGPGAGGMTGGEEQADDHEDTAAAE